MGLRQNSWRGRKGSLSLWKLRRPNLTLGFLRSGKTVEKLVTCSLLAGMALRPAVLAEGRPGGSDIVSRETPPAVGHNLASRTGDQDRNWDGEVHASHNLGFLACSAS